jgi:hypothetical protein
MTMMDRTPRMAGKNLMAKVVSPKRNLDILAKMAIDGGTEWYPHAR